MTSTPTAPSQRPAFRRTRLAPSPTGALHLGNAMAFAAAWAIARAQGWEVLLRIEDLDGPRVKPQSVAQIEPTLGWLGLDWDGPVLCQSHELGPYAHAASALAARGLAYPSGVTRRALEERGAGESGASAPNAGTTETVFPASRRPDGWASPRTFAVHGDAPAWRFATPARAVRFTDVIAGPQTHRPAQSVGDFPVWTKQGVPAYQLAVVVDDERQGVTDVVRGNDLLESAARQLLVRDALRAGPIEPGDSDAPLDGDAMARCGAAPRWWHVPLVVGPDGRRLAKRHGDTRVDTYRSLGVGPERIVGLVAWWLGAAPRREPMRAIELPGALAAAWSLDSGQGPRVPERLAGGGPIVFTPEDHTWLVHAARG